jgi:hypothetical protein
LDRGQEVAGKLIIEAADAFEGFQAAEAALDDIAALYARLLKGSRAILLDLFGMPGFASAVDDFSANTPFTDLSIDGNRETAVR